MTHYLIEGGLFLALWVTGVVTGWAWCSARRQRRMFDAQIEVAEKTFAERQAPRHARTDPRQTGGVPPWRSGSSTGSASNVSTGSIPAGKTPTATASATTHTRNRSPKRMVTTAADIPPVIWPQPGTSVPMRPQAGRTSGAGTQTMPRLTDTGELRKLTDDYIDRMRREDIEWRAKVGLL